MHALGVAALLLWASLAIGIGYLIAGPAKEVNSL